MHSRQRERADLLRVLVECLSADERVRAIWEGGSAAFERADAWSDLDVQVVAEEGTRDAVLELGYTAHAALGPLDWEWTPPLVAFEHASQRFWHLAGTPLPLYVDLFVVEPAGLAPLLVREVHGAPRVLLDRDGLLAPAAFDRAAHEARVAAHLASLRAGWPLFTTLVRKELGRGNMHGALGFYLASVLPNVARLVRIRYCPERFDWSLKYAPADLPADAADALLRLGFVAGAEELPARLAEADALFATTSAALG